MLTTWILTVLLAVAPPGRTPRIESAEEGRARYATIAADLDAVVTAESPLFGGRLGRARTAMLLAAVAFHESGFRRDVDEGRTRGSGLDVCIMQIRARSVAEADTIAHDRRACLRLGLSFVRRSMMACRESPLDDRLAAYASGSCSRGLPESRAMMGWAQRTFARHPPPKE